VDRSKCLQSATAWRFCGRSQSPKGCNPVSDMSAPQPTTTGYRGGRLCWHPTQCGRAHDCQANDRRFIIIISHPRTFLYLHPTYWQLWAKWVPGEESGERIQLGRHSRRLARSSIWKNSTVQAGLNTPHFNAKSHQMYRRTSISGTTFSGKKCLSGTIFHAIWLDFSMYRSGDCIPR
jgi:hypothetical protein